MTLSAVPRHPVALARVLRVAIVRRDRAYLGGKLRRAEAALERAMQAINAAASGLRLVTDIRNPWYDTRSIFSQDGDNTLKGLGVQDAMALRRHYPVRE